MSDLTTRLRAAIDERDRLARACDATDWRGPYAGVIVDRDVDGWQHGFDETVIFYCSDRIAETEHALANDPDATLRMVAAHRKILDEHESICTQYNDPTRTEPMAFGPGYGLWIAIVALAEGYGIEP